MKRGRPPYNDALTPAEWRVAEFIRHGLTNAAIAKQLQISSYAVRNHARAAVAKLGLPNRAALAHWPGIRKGSARLTQLEETMPTLATISQLSRRVENLTRACSFFKDTLGLTELYAFPGLAFFDLGGTRLMLRETQQKSDADILYFRVPDIGAAHQTLQSRGLAFTGAPHMIHKHPDGTEEWMAFFKDDEGRDLALHALSRP
jgi:DNA-binding CsgD family transcriptional regulator/catechol 2,3-dioxygenase-like lactoylglutathione lyase family enzyme